MSLKGVELSTETKELIVTLLQSVQNKALTVKTVKHSKNDYHECFRQVSKDWHSGDFDAKWKEKSFTNRDGNALKRLGYILHGGKPQVYR